MMVLAHVADMPSLAVRLGGMARAAERRRRLSAAGMDPKGGWQVDKALVYAFVRQGSSFNQCRAAPAPPA